ncbi:MAG TPA: DUF47 family protein [Xanthobacteraceae bacterium]|nr:DUF47 family protein [Xanthobacteraceae bacterium]
MKPGIVEQLGQTDLLLPARLAEGLAANARAKLRLSVLQAAASHARDPNGARFELGEECRAAGIDPVIMEALVNRATLSGGGRMAAPGLNDLVAAIWNDVTAMARAVQYGDATQGNAALERLDLLAGAAPALPRDEIELAQVAKLTAISDVDGLHRLVMDLHKALNRLAAERAEETIAGADAYGVLPQDRAPIAAFMRGVTATARLKFSHPGLATTATRSGERLIIQNDIGENDAHVVVVAVEPDAVTVTYTDIHLPRARFFAGLFKTYPVQWSGLERKSVAGLGEGGVFYLITGRCPTANDADRDAFLETLGASLVFLIDWNRARKLLRNWVAKADAVAILDWAARHRFGHRGFLELGGAEFLAAAVRHAAANRIGFGEQLDRVLGRDAAVDFLKTVLRVCAEALLQGSSVRLARDRIEADLVRHLQRVDTALLAIVIRQAGLARDIVADIARFLRDLRHQRQFDRAELTTNAQRIEEKADRIAVEARGEIARLDANRSIRRLVDQMEDAIDELEQAAFIASLVPKALAPELIDPLDELCSAVVAGTAAAAAGVAAAIAVPEGHRVDFEDALAAVGRLIDAEHSADTAERKAMANIVSGEFDLKSALPVIELAAALERATDRLAGFGHALREHVMADLTPD